MKCTTKTEGRVRKIVANGLMTIATVLFTGIISAGVYEIYMFGVGPYFWEIVGVLTGVLTGIFLFISFLLWLTGDINICKTI